MGLERLQQHVGEAGAPFDDQYDGWENGRGHAGHRQCDRGLSSHATARAGIGCRSWNGEHVGR